MQNTAVTQQPVPTVALWVRAFGSDYFDSLERKEQLTDLLELWEDVSYRHDMMPSFIIHQFTTNADEPVLACLKLWCGYLDGDGGFIANTSLVDEDGGWLCDLGSVCDLIALLDVDAPRAEPSSVDTLIDALQMYSQISITSEQESNIYQQYTALPSASI